MAAPRRITRTRVEPVGRLTAADREAMWALFARYYDKVTRAEFERDLDEKQYLIRMHDAAGGLCGFSTIQVLETRLGGRAVEAVFSGDTVIDRSVWGQKQLQRVFTRFLIGRKLRRPFGRVYWFLISKGHKTYLLMRNNLTMFPNYERATPPDVRTVLDHVARLKYPDRYDPDRGVIAYPDGSAVRSDVADVTPEAREDPDVRFFLERNPGWLHGDELCCLAELRLRELLLAGLKYGVWAPLRRLFGRRRRAPTSAPAEDVAEPRA